MATTTFQPYTGNGSNKDFNYSFPTFTASEVVVEVDGVVVDNFHIVSYSTTGTNTVRFDNGDGQGSNSSGTINNSVCNSTTGAPLNNKEVIVRRDTDVDNAKATFTAGSSLKAEDLTNSVTQILRALQEEQNTPTTTPRIRNAAITTAKIKADNITSALIADDQIDSEHYVAGSIDLEHMSANSVDSDQYVDGSIDQAHISNSAVGSNQIAANAVTTTEILNGAVTRAKLETDAIDGTKLADNAVNTEHYTDGSIERIHLEADIIDSTKLANNSVDSEHYVDGSIDTIHLSNGLINDAKLDSNSVTTAKIANSAVNNDKIANGTITSSKLNAATVITESEQASATTNDTSFLTSAAADARFFNISTGDTIKNGQSFPDNDTTIATTAAINDRIVDLVEEVGGFIPIANETSFPTGNPDLNSQHGQDASRMGGTIISVKTASTNLVPSGTTVTIADGRGTGLAVIITGVPSTIPSGFGFLVETTSTNHTYAFHRLTPKATEVTTVAGKATEIGRLGTAAAVEDMSILGTTDVVADMAILGTTDVVSDMNALAVSDVISDMNTLAVTSVLNDIDTVAGISSNVTTVAGIHGNVTTVAGIQANVTTVAGIQANVTTVAGIHGNVTTVANNNSNVTSVANNMANVNNFNDRYQIASNNPSTDGGGNALAAGDLYFNTSANELKVYNGSAWQAGVTATGNFALTTGNTFTGDNRYNDGVKALFGTGSDLEIYHSGSHSYIKDAGTGSLLVLSNQFALQNAAGSETLFVANENGSVDLYYDDSKKLETTSTGASITGRLGINTSSPTDAIHVVGTSLFAGNTYVTGHFYLGADNKKINVGASSDLQIYHDGANSLIDDAGTGILGLRSDSGINLYKKTGNEFMLKAIPDGAVELYYDSVKKFATTSDGVQVDGSGSDCNLTIRNSTVSASNGGTVTFKNVDGNGVARDVVRIKGFTGDSTGGYGELTLQTAFANTLNDCLIIRKDKNVELPNDNQSFKIGAGNDLQIYHSGTHSFIDHTNGAGHLVIGSSATNNVDIMKAGYSEYIARFKPDNSVELYYDNSKKFETLSYGAKVTGSLTATNNINNESDTGKFLAGASNDARMYHDGTDSYFDSITGNLYLLNHDTTGKDVIFGVGGAAKWRVTSSGHFRPNADSAVDIGTNTVRVANGYFDTLYGDGSNLTGINTDLVADTSPQLGGELDTNGYHIALDDSRYLKMGTDNDMQIYHTGNHGYLDNGTGNVYVRSGGGSIRLQPVSNEEGLLILPNSHVKLYHDNVLTAQTEVWGWRVFAQGYDALVQVQAEENRSAEVRIIADDGDDNGDYSRIRKDKDTNALMIQDYGAGSWQSNIVCLNNDSTELYYQGTLKLKTGVGGAYGSVVTANGANGWSGYSIDNQFVFMGNGSTAAGLFNDINDEWFVYCKANEDVRLYYDNSKKFETTSTGVSITGNVNPTGHVALPDSSELRLGSGDDLKIYHDGSNNYIKGVNNDFIYIATNNASRWSFANDGHFRPEANNTYDIGSTSQRVRNIYTNDLHLSNEGHSNDVDGTWGNWTIQEGESDLFLKNNRSGKKYKFNLTEVA